ncbi:hypothetical protein PCANC_14412 [Puccinia coronata f. sp. avenae]|uniref:CCHC-type domain-containing protein n=1 Tax=Puccinia coronata f. sp. avenae TaxID=200324 RepID=A0A2N5UZB7_9BASI|nr:hypothetical protein PCANC_14412 [Puccinia coronata f. sp. avenae]
MALGIKLIRLQEPSQPLRAATAEVAQDNDLEPISVEEQKQLTNAIARSDWPTFSGKGEYDHMDFMHWINLVQRHSWLPDGVIVLKLLTILTDGAPLWFKTMEASHKNKKRSFWCGELCKKYGTSSWKRKKEDTFDQDKFVAGETVPEEWVTRQYNRLECFSPGLSQGSINYKLLKLMDSKVEFAVKTAMQNTEADLSELTHILEDICNKIQIGRRRFVPKDVDMPKILPATASKPKAPREPLTCYLCGAKGHTSRRCPKKVNAVDGDEPLPDDEAGSEYDPGEPIIGVIRLSSGKNNLVQMLCCEKECFVLLDSGAIRHIFDFNESINAVMPEDQGAQAFFEEASREDKFVPELTKSQKLQLVSNLERFSEAFTTADQPFGAIEGHQVAITLTVERPYPLALRKAPYPASPRNQEAIEQHIVLLTKMGIIQKVGSNKGA